MTTEAPTPEMVTLPPMELAFARTLLMAANRDAAAMARAWGISSADKHRWVVNEGRFKKMLEALPVPRADAPQVEPEAFDELFG